MFRQLPKPPLAERLTIIANDLYEQIKKNPDGYDKKIYAKYQVKKYSELKNKDGELVEAWIFNADSKPFPILENQLLKSAEALIEAAKLRFSEEQHPRLAELDTLWQGVKVIIDEFYKESPNNEAGFKNQVKRGKECIFNLINDILYLWGRTHKDSKILTSDKYKEFYDNLWKNFEKITPTYKISHILAVNEADDVNSAQYIERGAHLFDRKHPDNKPTKKHYRSPHERDAQGLANYFVYGTGHLTEENEIVITDTGHRHASLPPIDLYKKEKKDKLGDGYLQAECIEITKRNMADDFREAQLHAGEIKSEEAKNNLSEEKATNKTKFNVINVSLLTVGPLDHQDRQYEETILAAELLRAEHPEWNRVSFDFGVDFLAIGRLPLYPDHQKFENQRELFRFKKIFIDQIEFILKNIPNDSFFKDIFAIYRGLTIGLHDAEVIEQAVQKAFEEFKQCYAKFQNDPNDDNRKTLKLAKEKFQHFKKNQYDALNSIIAEYKQGYALIQPDIHKLFAKLRETRTNEKLWTEVDEILLLVFKDYDQIHTYFFGNLWQQPEHNFEMQARIVTLTTNLQKLAAIYPNVNNPTYTEASSNCKSTIDRNLILSAKIDQLRAKRAQNVSQKELDEKKHFSGSAYAVLPANATYGGSSKFGRSFGMLKETGHPDPDYAKLQIMTTGLGADKLKNSYLKYGLLVPAEMKLGLRIQKLKEPTILSDAYREYLLPLSKPNSPLFSLVKDIDSKIMKYLDNPKEYDPYKFAAEVIQDFLTWNEQCPLPQEILISFQHFIDTITPPIEPVNYSPVFDEEKNDAELEEKHRAPSLSDTASITSSHSSSPLEAPEEHENRVKQFRDKNGYAFWRKEIDNAKTQVNNKVIGFFYKAALATGLYDSTATKAVDRTYKEYCEKPALDFVGKVKQIDNVILAVTAWINEKHGGSQFEKSKKSSEAASPKLRASSRLLCMEALLEAMVREKQQKLLSYIDEFRQLTFVNPTITQKDAPRRRSP